MHFSPLFSFVLFVLFITLFILLSSFEPPTCLFTLGPGPYPSKRVMAADSNFFHHHAFDVHPEQRR